MDQYGNGRPRSRSRRFWNIGMMGAHIFVQFSFVGGPANECPTRHFALCFTPVRNLISRTGKTVEKLEKKKWSKGAAVMEWRSVGVMRVPESGISVAILSAV